MSIFELQGLKIVPDIIHEYKEHTKANQTPLIIDNGSYECRVGWATSENPMMIFRNLIAKPRREKVKKDGELPLVQPTQVGNDIVNIEAMRYQLRTQFDRNVVTHYYNQEQIFDDIFKHLAIDTENCVNHPIVLTECVANPNYCRQLMSELLFECYDVPAICYGIDSLFSFKHNNLGENGLIVSIGYYTIHIIPVLNGVAQYTKIRRINLGGFQIITFLHRLLQLKYPVHVNAISLSRIEWLLHTHCSVAYDYLEELKKWSSLEFYEKNVKKIQLPYNAPVNSTNVTLTAEQKNEKKREMAKRLVEMNARKREERLNEDRQQLEKLINIKRCYERGEMKEYQKGLRQNLLSNREELEKIIQAVRNRVDRAMQKMNQTETMANNSYEEKIPQPPNNMSIEAWVVDIRRKRAAIVERRNSRKQRKQDLAKRRTVAAQERMRIISQLARKEKDDDDFGMRDEDWDVYKTISKDDDSDSDVENEKLIEFDSILRNHDPSFEEPQITQECAAEYYQLHLGLESIRAPELLFQPSMIGISEAGITETIDYVLKQFSPEDQLLLAQNIFLTGGCANFKGLKERLNREMMQIRPFQTAYNVVVAKNVNLDAWCGAQQFANSNNFKEFLTTKSDYMEFGGEYIKEHYASNKYCPTPAEPNQCIETDNTSNIQTSDVKEEEIYVE
ncbi:actin-related protein 5 [Contarinia nasturtii]|uniref:actin-related protein 5 n=1 Tax=Contarinia nasturtii TaxID=265458 RepID=UPI0012D38845|nr:actin-related protein 5 [Contarinia nasturtii]